MGAAATKGIAAVSLALALAACRSSSPPVEEFLLAPLAIARASAAPTPGTESGPDAEGEAAPADATAARRLPPLRLEPLNARGFLDRREICWREGPVRAGPYRYRRWGEPPAEAVTRQLVELLRARGRFEQVDASALAEGAVRVGGDLLALHEESDESGDDPHGVAAIELAIEVTSASDGGPTARRIVHVERRVAAADDSMEALVAAISAALAEVLLEVAAQIEEAAAQAAS